MKWLLIIFILSLAPLSFSQEKQLSIKEMHQNLKRIKKSARKLPQHGSNIDTLIADKNLTIDEYDQFMKAELDWANTCPEQNHLSHHLKVIEKLWEQTGYINYSKKYSAIETSSQIGKTNYDIEIERDPADTKKIYIKNFYNIGFEFKITVTESNGVLTIPLQTYNSSTIQGTGTVNKSGAISMSFTSNDGSAVDKCELYLQPITKT